MLCCISHDASLAGRQMQIALHIRRVNIWRQNGALWLNTRLAQGRLQIMLMQMKRKTAKEPVSDGTERAQYWMWKLDV